MKNKSHDIYFGADEPDKLVPYLQSKSQVWFDSLVNTNYLDKIKRSWLSYHGIYYEDAHSISFGGETGELVNLPVNHFRNIADHILTIVTSTRPSFQARSVNTDTKSQIQTKRANGLLEYYMREKRLERDLKKACQYAIVMGSGFIKMEWNATGGEVYDFIEAEMEVDEFGDIVLDENGEPTIRREGYPIYQGDVEFTVLSPFDVVFDSTKESSNHDWQLCRSFKNKYDLAAKYPEYEEKIKGLKTKSDLQKTRISLSPYDSTVDVPVYEFFHKPTESLPEGRYVLYLDSDIVLIDSVLPYRKLPVFKITPSEILGTSYGYTSMFDLLPLQDAANSLYSTILTNQNAFGVQNLYVERGSDIITSQLSGGLNVIEGNPGFSPPKSLNLTQTPAEIFNFVGMLVRDMETISGINSVARGNPEASLRSGNALALVQSQALQFISGLQQSYIQLIEDVGTNLVDLLKDFASVPRIAQIAGKSNQTYMKEFTGDDLSTISRVIVDAGNALANCLEKGTEILMFDGSIKKVEDIKVGDFVMGPDSKLRTVGNVNQGTEMMYKVESLDSNVNVSYGCNESHILTLRYCSDDKRYNAKKGDILDITVKDYLKLTKRQKRLLQGFKTGVDFSTKELSIPPYILGTWLGDGGSKTTSITTSDSEILKEWSEYSNDIKMEIRLSTCKNSGKASTYFITSGKQNGCSDRNVFLNHLKELSLINNKHIPDHYKTSSRSQRLEILAGLIDTDGSRVDNTLIFTQKSEKLTNDVIFLAQSLGFKVKYKKKKIYPSKLVPNAFGETNYVAIGGNTWEIPCRIVKKQCKEKPRKDNWLNYGIKVSALEKGTYYGFTLKEEPHFVLGDFSVTHNTTAGKVQMAEQMMQMGVIKTPEEYISVINTGKLETMTEGQSKQLILVRSENERLVDGNTEIRAVLTDDHSLHLREHSNVLADPDLRMDADLVQRTLEHMQQHIDILSNPQVANILMSLGQQPIQEQPQQPPQPSPEGMGENPEILQNTQAEDVNVAQNQGSMPTPPQAAGVQEGILPEQPLTPEQLARNNSGG